MPAGPDAVDSQYPAHESDQPLLDVRHLSVSYPSPGGPVRAVRDLSFRMKRGEILALVGETGCGKSTLAMALLGLAESGGGSESCRILFEGSDLGTLDSRGWRSIRGRKIGMIFQDARSALNPVLTVGDHLIETLRAHERISPGCARQRAESVLAEVGIPDAAFCMRRHPLELSGGICQRVAIALALCHRPLLLVADEPTSALDSTLQAQVLSLLCDMSRREGLALLLISHDLALVASYADRVAVMYHGRLVEAGDSREIFAGPAHPYTRGLLESQPTLDHDRSARPLSSIPGVPPPAGLDFRGCAFAPRCSLAEPRCSDAPPAETELSRHHWVRCITVSSARREEDARRKDLQEHKASESR